MKRFIRRSLWLVLPLSGFILVVLGMPLMPVSPLDPQIAPLIDRADRDRVRDDAEFHASERFYVRQLYRLYIHDAASRLNVPRLTGMSDNAFAGMIAAKFLVEDATIYADHQPVGLERQLATLPPAAASHELRAWAEVEFYQGEISWGPANIAYPNAQASLLWWKTRAGSLGHKLSDVHTAYYSTGQRRWFTRWLFGWDAETALMWEMQTGQGAVEMLALTILYSADRARSYYSAVGQTTQPLSAYTVAMGVEAYSAPSTRLYALKRWESRGFYHNWVEIMGDTARTLGLKLTVPEDYLPYTRDEQRLLGTLPAG